MARRYPSDLTDEQWALVEPLIPVYPGGRPRETDMREVVNAILYLVRTGCQWRYLPKDLPPKSTVWGYFNEWRRNGTLKRIHDGLREMIRLADDRQPTPSAGSIDSQSAPTTEGGEQRGYDAAKKIKGRKRHIAVDTLGLLLAAVVTAANVDDAAAAQLLLQQLPAEHFPRLERLWADQKYHNHTLRAWVAANCRFEVEVVRRPEGAQGFILLPKRWTVERTFAWLKRCRRLSVDREKTIESSVAMVRLAMIHLMVNRLCPSAQQEFNYRYAA